MNRGTVDVLGQLGFIVVLVTASFGPAVHKAHRMRRAVPGMSWRMAWALTAPRDRRNG